MPAKARGPRQGDLFARAAARPVSSTGAAFVSSVLDLPALTGYAETARRITARMNPQTDHYGQASACWVERQMVCGIDGTVCFVDVPAREWSRSVLLAPDTGFNIWSR